ncbi:MAG: hypothetical protein KAU10_06190, partial [Dehalococcoidia bacterium]|nr:hypothetical protein [Dehalococcoidia bacterium]
MRTGVAQSALFVLLALICACSSATPGPTPPAEPPAAADPQYAESLARQFCPIIHLKGDGDATENFEPEQIEIMVDEALLRDIGDPSFSEKASLSKLLQWSRGVYYLDLAGKGPDTQSLGDYQRTYGEIRDSYR